MAAVNVGFASPSLVPVNFERSAIGGVGPVAATDTQARNVLTAYGITGPSPQNYPLIATLPLPARGAGFCRVRALVRIRAGSIDPENDSAIGEWLVYFKNVAGVVTVFAVSASPGTPQQDAGVISLDLAAAQGANPDTLAFTVSPNTDGADSLDVLVVVPTLELC